MSDIQIIVTSPAACEREFGEKASVAEGLQIDTTDKQTDTAEVSEAEPCSPGGSDLSEMEPFADYLPKIENLLRDIGLEGFSAEAIQHGYTYINCVYELKSPSDENEQYILRVPVCPDNNPEGDEKCQSIIDDASLLNYLATDLPVPCVRAYDATRNNALKSPFTVQTRLPGQSLDNIWTDMDHEDKLVIVDQYVELLAKLESIQFTTAGSFKAPSELPDKMNNFFISAPPSISIFDKGPEEIVRDPKTVQDRSGTDVQALLLSHLNTWIAKDLKDEDRFDLTVPKYQQLLAVMEDMAREGSFQDKSHPIVLNHWDLEPRNIMIEKRDDEWPICGLIDWDDALAMPRPLARRAPDWIWDPDCEGFTGYFDNDHHPNKDLSEDQLALKAYFDTKAAAALPGYLEDAYGSGLWMRRIWTLVRGDLHNCWYLDVMEQVGKDWNERSKPITPELQEPSMPAPEEEVEPAFEQPLAPEVEKPTVLEPEKPKNLWRKSIGWLSLRVKALRA